MISRVLNLFTKSGMYVKITFEMPIEDDTVLVICSEKHKAQETCKNSFLITTYVPHYILFRIGAESV